MVPGPVSGIAGILVPAGRMVDAPLLQRMAASMSARGPDGQHTWTAGRIGFAHTRFVTSDAEPAAQPCTVDGHVWITADVRIDGRRDLVRKLEAAGCISVSRCCDAQLILHAYAVWAERCIDHLIGDFAFAIWDGRRGRLFCARDHFGVKPFYYAEVDGGIVFSNSLDCVRLHPAVGDALNDLSIADFLVFGFPLDPAATAFARVSRLPPAHSLIGGTNTAPVRRYWTIPSDGHIRFRRSQDYVEHFTALWREAVGDRIGGGRPAIWLSGGIDSTAIAVTASENLTARGASFQVAAHTVVYDRLIPDDERRYAAIAAHAAGTVPRYWPADDVAPFDGWQQPGPRTPEPIDDPYFAFQLQQLHEMAADGRVALAGDGGDELLWRSYAADLIGKMPLLEFAAGLARCVFLHQRRPAFGARAKLGAWRKRPAIATLPHWLNADLVKQWELRDRVEQSTTAPPKSAHPLRPEACERLSSTALPTYFERADPGFTGVAVEHRWPFLDLRLVNYVLAIPPLPWCVEKDLLRSSMQGSVPAALLGRKKTPLAADPLQAHLQAAQPSWLDRFEAAPQLARFVNRDRVPPVTGPAASENVWTDLRPFCLNYWLSRGHDHAT